MADVLQTSQSQVLRDKDLLEPDEWLTEPELDNLWDWFCSAKVDPQLVFTKLVNSVRKPYRNHILNSYVHGTNIISESGQRTPGTEWTVTDIESELGHDEDELRNTLGEMEQQCERQQNTISQLQEEANKRTEEYSQLESQKKQLELELKQENPNTLTKVRVALKSVAFQDRYVQMVGSSGRVCVGTTVGGWETFELVRHQYGVVSFKSTCPPEMYLSVADGDNGVGPGIVARTGGGRVMGKRTCGDNEKFLIHVAEHGQIGIEPLLFRGRFLRLDGNYYESICLQGVKGLWERFYLVVIEMIG